MAPVGALGGDKMSTLTTLGLLFFLVYFHLPRQAIPNATQATTRISSTQSTLTTVRVPRTLPGTEQNEKAFSAAELRPHRTQAIQTNNSTPASNKTILENEWYNQKVFDRNMRPSQFQNPSRTEPLSLWTVFAGRENVMKLQVPYLREALENRIIDEVHLFDFTCKSKKIDERIRNAKFLRDLVEQIPGVFLITTPKCNWEDYYKYYKIHSHEDDVILKIDDDIIFVDTSRLKSFIDMVRSKTDAFLWSANVINNGKCALFQQEAGLLPANMTRLSNNLELRQRGIGDLYANRKLGMAIHKEFLANQQKFFRKVGGRLFYSVKSRLSINFVAWRGGRSEEVYRLTAPGNDEHRITYQATVQEGLPPVIVYGPLLVSHASFHPQFMDAQVVKLYTEAQPIQNKNQSPLGDTGNTTWASGAEKQFQEALSKPDIYHSLPIRK